MLPCHAYEKLRITTSTTTVVQVLYYCTWFVFDRELTDYRHDWLAFLRSFVNSDRVDTRVLILTECAVHLLEKLI